MTDRRLRLAAIILALVGLGVASYLTYIHYKGIDPACGMGANCVKVQTSEWSKLAGVPVALLGLIGYVLILISLFIPGETLQQRLDDFRGEVYVRRRRTPLSEEESARLTEFALAAYKKPIPPGRFIAQVTPLRKRGPLRTNFVGKPRGPDHGFICSELVVEALVAAGQLDFETARPAATLPRDTRTLWPRWYRRPRWGRCRRGRDRFRRRPWWCLCRW